MTKWLEGVEDHTIARSRFVAREGLPLRAAGTIFAGDPAGLRPSSDEWHHFVVTHRCESVGGLQVFLFEGGSYYLSSMGGDLDVSEWQRFITWEQIMEQVPLL